VTNNDAEDALQGAESVARFDLGFRRSGSTPGFNIRRRWRQEAQARTE